MATIVLQAAGAFLGGMLGPVGTAIGTAAGALAGYSIDRALIDSTRHIEGPRLSGARPFTAEEGAPIPRVYGATRIGGTLIWATRFEEARTTKRQGSKGGPRVTEYAYFANVAFALCEGEIAGIRRIWADGHEIDRNSVELRVYRGSEDQPVDPLIEARQGAGNAPAYRGVAYVVLDHFPLGEYGNRIPQLQFEVLRPVGELRKQVRAVALIPGATEYGLSSELVTRRNRPGETQAENRHMLFAGTDIAASLDELQMLCPNLEHVALVATWFGDDLRAGNCRIRPAVTSRTATGFSQEWSVSGVERDTAMVVSYHNGGAAYGGSPSDSSVVAAIKEIRARGLKVTLYPFVMMDIAAANTLPNPYGGSSQPPYPWRGRITSHPAPMQPASAERTATARIQVESFCGAARQGEFQPSGGTILFGGAADDWGYRRFILHFAHLAVLAGGVDAFLVGTEFLGLTTLRDQNDSFPFVEALCALAADVRAIVGSGTAITYGADWSEYFGHQPADGSGDVYFHLDTLWAHPAVDAVGIDNYMPLSDWRDTDYSAPNPDGLSGPYDLAGLRAAIAGGEGYDWYYPSAEARERRERSPITDGAYGKPWVYRYKDLVNWWGNVHHQRINGVEAAQPTAWVPGSKPIWFTELGCPAVDKGPNQPNVFPDPKSVEGAVPYFSDGGRSDAAQRRFLEAHAGRWNPDDPSFVDTENPISSLYGGRMVDASRIYLWAWDARPFPAFPLREDMWSDGSNWHRGHWLNGRLSSPSVGGLINEILKDHGLSPADVSDAVGTVDGYVISNPASARSSLEPIVNLFDLGVSESAGRLVFRRNDLYRPPITITELADDAENAVLQVVRAPDHQLPAEAILAFRDPLAEYQTASVRNSRFGASGSRQQITEFPGVLEAEQGRALLGDRMRRIWSEREAITFAIPAPGGDVLPGAVVRLPQSGLSSDFLVTEIEDGLVRRVTAKQMARSVPTAWNSSGGRPIPDVPVIVGQPYAQFLDLPASSSGVALQDHFRVAIWQKPWRRQLLFASPEETGFAQRNTISHAASVGRLVDALPGGVQGRFDQSNSILVELFDSEVASVSRLQLLNGANAAAIQSNIGVWEIVQFQMAEEISANMWRLTSLLRGQLGTNDAMDAGAASGASFVLLDEAVQPAGLLAGEIGLPLNWRAGPVVADFSSVNYVTQLETGGLRAGMPLSPVHLKAIKQANGDQALSWIRRGRIDADSWAASEIPLGEESEQYQIVIAAAGGGTVRTEHTSEPTWLYPAASIATDLGPLPIAIDLTVMQLSRSSGWGIPATRRLLLL
ncbi:baseplate multidomain protein megatron [Pseudaminobacter sp. NGMCC 1.201702]|uniref:baseplate multidomain protein megatron n=1 Tax=Pseudaminobacter sp. NGMCC 1.201702 TaxID=3391825 RepID=UPI0039EFCEDF